MPPTDPPDANSGEYHWESKSQIDPATQAKEEQWAHEQRLERAQRIAQEELRKRLTPEQNATVEAHWQAEYEFFHKLLSEEVDRLRWNDGLEPVEVDLYPVKVEDKSDPLFVGSMRIGSNHFAALGTWCRDGEGSRVLKVRINVKK